jgi:5-methylcytosine-specific restriction protein A
VRTATKANSPARPAERKSEEVSRWSSSTRRRVTQLGVQRGQAPSPDERGYRRVMPRAPTVCRVPSCPNSEPCPDHPKRRGSTRAWRRLRLQALRRDRYLCSCGALASEVDHVLARERGGRDELSNLRSLCSDCHAVRHGRHSASQVSGGFGHHSPPS